MAAAMAFSTGNGVGGVRPHPPWPRKGHAACYGFFPGNGVGGVRPHPPWPPLIKGGKGHGGRDGFFHGERCRWRASLTPPRKGGYMILESHSALTLPYTRQPARLDQRGEDPPLARTLQQPAVQEIGRVDHLRDARELTSRSTSSTVIL